MKLSYIVPSLFKSDVFIEQINRVANNPIVGEVIIINNAMIDAPHINDNIRIITPDAPSFCNGGWNIGVENSSNEYIVLATDDISFSSKALNKLIEKAELIPNLGVIGLDYNIAVEHDLQNEEFDITLAEAPSQRPYRFAYMMMMKRSEFIKIPDGIKHWYGDDFIFYSMMDKNLKNYLIQSEKFRLKTNLENTINSQETIDRINQDRIFWMSNYYDKFSKFGTKCG